MTNSFAAWLVRLNYICIGMQIVLILDRPQWINYLAIAIGLIAVTLNESMERDTQHKAFVCSRSMWS